MFTKTLPLSMILRFFLSRFGVSLDSILQMTIYISNGASLYIENPGEQYLLRQRNILRSGRFMGQCQDGMD